MSHEDDSVKHEIAEESVIVEKDVIASAIAEASASAVATAASMSNSNSSAVVAPSEPSHGALTEASQGGSGLWVIIAIVTILPTVGLLASALLSVG